MSRSAEMRLKIARLYYEQGMRQQAIKAEKARLSRSWVGLARQEARFMQLIWRRIWPHGLARIPYCCRLLELSQRRKPGMCFHAIQR